jgi:hypothetical protein
MFKNTVLMEDASDASAEAAAQRVKATGATFMKFYDGLTEPMIARWNVPAPGMD